MNAGHRTYRSVLIAVVFSLFPVSCAHYNATESLLGILLLPRNPASDSTPSTPAPSYNSCKELLAQNPGSADGKYSLDLFNNGSSTDVECDMTTNGGGWTGITISLARNSLNGTIVAVIVAATDGFDANDRPFTRNPGTHSYHYTFDFPAGFSEFYLRNYAIKANSGGGDTSELGGAAMTTWDQAYNGSRGDIGFGSAAEAGPLVSYVGKGNLVSCNSCTLNWNENGSIYSLSSGSTQFRIAWGEAGGQEEGWYPWWQGEIFLR